ncbi:hypothetical protein M422DRAFT_249981 [Sphaerobolus stellatus SS14]|nr:hypothetical protein M422DRAFT_249981 [Sphaerobolus stellatus SS14]
MALLASLLSLGDFTIDHIAVDEIMAACPKLGEPLFSRCQVESLTDGEDSPLLGSGIRLIRFNNSEVSTSILRALLVRLVDRAAMCSQIKHLQSFVFKVEFEKLEEEFSEIFAFRAQN